MIPSAHSCALAKFHVCCLRQPAAQLNSALLITHPAAVCLCRNVDLGVDLDSRVAIVGANGTGKSTLLKLMTGQLEPLDGLVKRHNHLRIGVYHQHLVSLAPRGILLVTQTWFGCCTLMRIKKGYCAISS